MKKIIFTLVYIYIFLIGIAILACSDDANNSNISADNISIIMGVVPKNVLKNSQPIEVEGYPIEISLRMQSRNTRRILGYYVHILQRESGSGIQYYYQGSTAFFDNLITNIPVWLGRAGTIDLNKTFEIYAIVNKDHAYEKNIHGVKVFEKLSSPPVAMITVKRTK
ncbi:MAG TPA: hypothetical protein PKM65_09345 [Spirochaetota bacterium]|nr:hypothetical protein [Spirochaetota bacterium]HNT12766.1 hypothetical protein [Spirochaetota bacterium]